MNLELETERIRELRRQADRSRGSRGTLKPRDKEKVNRQKAIVAEALKKENR